MTNDDQLADWMATFARHGGKGDHIMEGINSRMDGLQAAILNAKLPHLPAWTAARRRVAACYNELLEDVGDVITPTVESDRDHVYHLYVIRTENRDALREHLSRGRYLHRFELSESAAILSRLRLSWPRAENFPAAYFNQSRILSLPIYPEMTEEAITHVANTISHFWSSECSKVIELTAANLIAIEP